MRHSLWAFFFFLSLLAGEANAQSFYPGMVMIQGGAEFGAAATQLDDPSPTAEVTGIAMFRNLPFGLEVGVAERFGIGFQYRMDKYLNHTDSVRASARDYCLVFNYHPVVTTQTNSFIGLKAGISNFEFEKNRNGSTFEKQGSCLQLCTGVNMLFLNHMGLQLSFGVNGLLYHHGELKDPSSPLTTPYGVRFIGIDLGLGVIILL